jgi:hypothetical protein
MFIEKGKLCDVLLRDLEVMDLHIYFKNCAVYNWVHIVAVISPLPLDQ